MTYAPYDDVEAGRLAGMHMPLTTARSAHAPSTPHVEHDGRDGVMPSGSRGSPRGRLRSFRMVSAGDRGHPGVAERTHDTYPRDPPAAAQPVRTCLPASAGAWLAAEIHPAVFRVGFVVLTLLGRAGILIYAAAALVIPDRGRRTRSPAALRNRRDRPWPLIEARPPRRRRRRPAVPRHAVAGDSWWLFLIAGGVILWLTRTPGAGATDDATELAARDSRRVRRALGTFAIVVASLVTLALVAAAIFLTRIRRGRQHRRPQVRGHSRGGRRATTGSGSGL